MIKIYPTRKCKIGEAHSLNDIVNAIRCPHTSPGITQKEELPHVLFSVSQNHTNKEIVNITEHSGLFILDFDRKDNPDVDFRQLKEQCIKDQYTRACFNSPSGWLKVIVEGNINPTDLHLHNLFYSEIANYYSNKYQVVWDKSNININRGCYIPFDPNAYYNPNSSVYQLSKDTIDSSIELKKIKHLKDNNKTKEVHDYSLDNTIVKLGVHHYTLLINIYKEIFNKYRFIYMSSDDPLLELEFEMNYYKSNEVISYTTRVDEYCFKNINDKNIPIYIEGGLYVADIRLPQGTVITSGVRNKTIGSISMKLIFNNPMADYSKLLYVLQKINIRYCAEPLSTTEVESILKNNYLKYLNGELDFSSVIRKTSKGVISPKYVFFSRYCTLLKDIKREVAIRKYHEMRRDKTGNIIYDAIEQLQCENKKITKENINKITGYSISTIKRNWKQFKDVINDYNENISFDRISDAVSLNADESNELITQNKTSIPEIEAMIAWFNNEMQHKKKLRKDNEVHPSETEDDFTVLEDYDDY